MQTVSKEYLQAIQSPNRNLHIKMQLSSGKEITGSDFLQSFTISETANSEDSLTMGNVCCNQVDINLFTPDFPVAFTNEKVVLYSGLKVNQEIEWVCLGSYYIQEIKRDNKNKQIVLTGYDSMYRCNQTYVSGINYPAKLSEVINDIAQFCKLGVKEHEYPDIIIDSYPKDVICKELLGYMAGLMGKNAFINREDKIEFYWYTPSNQTISQSLQYQDSFIVSDEMMTVNSITSGSEENPLVCGNGQGIAFGNPYMTQDILDSIFKQVEGFSYLPCNVQWRGNPAIEIKDSVMIENKDQTLSTILLMENKTIYGGGLYSQVVSKGKKEKDVVYSKSPTDIKLHKVYTTLINAFKESAETILGHKGGYFTITTNEEGFPSGWTIMDTPTLRPDTKLWQMNQKGLCFSNDGGKTVRDAAINMDGSIVANSITTGLLQGNNFSLDLNSGAMSLGKRDANGVMSEEWLKADDNGLYIKAMREVGSNNLLQDSMGMFNGMFSEKAWIGTFNIDSSVEVKNRNIYGYALLLKNDTLKQTQRVPNGEYTVSFIYKKHLPLATVYMLINGKRYDLLDEGYINSIEKVTVTSNELEIQFISDSDNACTIINLMANQGDVPSVWSLGQGETWDEYVKIGHGIQIGNEATKVTFVAMADTIGFKSNATNQFVSIFTDVGLNTDEVTVKNKATMVNLLIQDIGGQTVINKIGGK